VTKDSKTPTDEEWLVSDTADALSRKRRQALAFMVFFCGIAILGCVASFILGHALWLTITSVCSTVIGLYAISWFLQHRNVLNSPLLKLIRNDPEDVAWLFPSDTQPNTYGMSISSKVHVRCISGRAFVLNPVDAPTVIRELAKWCPVAHRGYSPKFAAAWESNPVSLKQLLPPSRASKQTGVD